MAGTCPKVGGGGGGGGNPSAGDYQLLCGQDYWFVLFANFLLTGFSKL